MSGDAARHEKRGRHLTPWSFACFGRFARRTKKKERLLVVYYAAKASEIIIIIIIKYLTKLNPSAEAVRNGCPGQLKN